jgi:acyl carrier protein
MSIHDIGVKPSGNVVEPAHSGRPEQLRTQDASWQEELLKLWKKILKTDSVSIDDDFFEMGGDSYLAIDLHMEVERLTGQKLPELTLFEAPTVRLLAERLSIQPTK